MSVHCFITNGKNTPQDRKQMRTITIRSLGPRGYNYRLSFMEYPHQKGISHANISNNMAGIRMMFIMYGVDATSFKDKRLPFFVKSLRINSPLFLEESENYYYTVITTLFKHMTP